MAPQTVVEDGTSFAPRVDRSTIPAHVPEVHDPIGRWDFEARPGMANLYGGLGTREQIQDELDEIAAHIRSFFVKQPDEVMVECSAYTARLTEISVLLHRVEGLDRQYRQVRTMQVQRYLDELDRQYKTASRLLEVQKMDLAMSGAQT